MCAIRLTFCSSLGCELRADAHNQLLVYSKSYITCTHLVPIERLVVSFYLTFIQVGNIGFSRGTGEPFKTELTAYTTFTCTFSTTFYSLLTSLKSYELTSLIADQLFQITCILRRLLDRCSCWEIRRWSIMASSLVLLFVYEFYVL
jgi:hypothetical protein